MLSTFLDFLDRIEHSQLISYSFENAELRFQLYHPGSTRMISFLTPTDTVLARAISDDVQRATGSIVLIDLDRRLDIRHGRYFPPTETSLLLADAADRVMLAYGRRCSEYRWLLGFRGEQPLLHCLIRDPAEIVWTIE